jgi:hypothetical protein
VTLRRWFGFKNATFIFIRKMSLLIVDDDKVTESDLMLHDEDFPDSFKDMKHPEDGVIVDSAIIPDFIRHRRPHHHRLLFRVSFKLTNGKYVPFTFVCDTRVHSTCHHVRIKFLAAVADAWKMMQETLS